MLTENTLWHTRQVLIPNTWNKIWAHTIILVFSIVSFVSVGDFFIGAVLGIARGALGLSLRRYQAEYQQSEIK